MGNFEHLVPKGNQKEPERTVIDLIPVGRDSAVKRDDLRRRCARYGLVDPDASESTQDRQMRRLIEKARVDYTILNLSNGKGYYRPSFDDLKDLQRYIRQEDSRAKASFRNHEMAKKLYEDYKSGRMETCQTES